MRTLTVAVTAAILAAVLIFSRAVEPPSRAAAKDVDGKQPRWFKVVFGLDGQDAVWDGKVRVNGGELLDIDPWSFEARDQVDADDSSWTIRTATIAEGSKSKLPCSLEITTCVPSPAATCNSTPREGSA